jgi:hypothetical protein
MKTRSFQRLLFACVLIGVSLFRTQSASAAETWIYGTLTNVTTGSSGDLNIMVSTGVPTNCAGVPFGWMTIPAASKTMIALALLTLQNRGAVTVYTFALSGGQCVINQFDPDESTF